MRQSTHTFKPDTTAKFNMRHKHKWRTNWRLMFWRLDTKQVFHLVLFQITADGSIDCQNTPGEQEAVTAHLHFCEAVTALSLLTPGGNFVLKMFTLFEHQSVSLMYLLNTAFREVKKSHRAVVTMLFFSVQPRLCLKKLTTNFQNLYFPGPCGEASDQQARELGTVRGVLELSRSQPSLPGFIVITCWFVWNAATFVNLFSLMC